MKYECIKDCVYDGVLVALKGDIHEISQDIESIIFEQRYKDSECFVLLPEDSAKSDDKKLEIHIKQLSGNGFILRTRGLNEAELNYCMPPAPDHAFTTWDETIEFLKNLIPAGK